MSPIKIDAGLKLYGKNPIQEPASVAVNNAPGGKPASMDKTIRHKDAIDETPAARPSKPSIKLTAFVMATIQITVAGIDKKCIYCSPLPMKGIVIKSIRIPNTATIVAAKI